MLRRKSPVTTDDKECAKCGEVKPRKQFYNDKNRVDGKYPYCKDCQKVLMASKENVKRRAAYLRHWNYGVTPEAYSAKWKRQRGRCAICKRKLGKDAYKTHTDHDHATGNFRGILCSDCNLGLGHFKDNIEFLNSAKTYLEKGAMA